MVLSIRGSVGAMKKTSGIIRRDLLPFLNSSQIGRDLSRRVFQFVQIGVVLDDG